MKEFSFKTRIFYGEGALERLRRVRNKKVLIVTDHFISSIGLPAKIAEYLTDCQVSVFDGVVPDPPIEVVAAGISALQACGADTLIAVGGGSTIDAAKVIRIVAKETMKVDTDKWECFAIPTTSGTGSEVTDYAVISNRTEGIKYPLASRKLEPAIAILDPELTVSVPPTVTADTGMDVLTHAIEAYVSTGASDFSDALAEKAMEIVYKYLRKAYENGKDRLAREKMHIASCMAGLAFNAAGLGVNHGMAHAIGAKLHISHGRINAILLPYIISYNAELETINTTPCRAALKYQEAAKRLGLVASTPAEGVVSLVSTIVKMNLTMKIPTTLKAWGANPDRVEELRSEIVAAALADATTSFNPRKVTAEDLNQLLTQVTG